jgi:molybdopterin-guanine dinucleotide biosynthesis protein B
MKESPATPAVVGIAGWKNSGKTTLAMRLIAEFTRRGLRVAAVKHAHHAFRIDEGETDSARHRRAGAGQVAIVARTRWALVRELKGDPEPTLDAVISWLDPCDLVIVEGYKSATIPKIEVRRSAATGAALSDRDRNVIAIAADHAVVGARAPVFPIDDVVAIADLITVKVLSSGAVAP